MYTHVEILPVLIVSDGSSEICAFQLTYLLVLLSITLHFFVFLAVQPEGIFLSEMVCKSAHFYDLVNSKYTAKYVTDHGWTNKVQETECVDPTFCERDILSNCVKHEPDTW